MTQFKKRIIGIDQSLRYTGLFWAGDGFISHMEIRPGALRAAERLAYIRDKLSVILDAVKPEGAAMEGYSYGSPGRLAELGEVGGVIKSLLHEREIPFIIATPSQVKKYATGKGVLPKGQEKSLVIKAINQLLDLELRDPTDNNIADAAALALIARDYFENNTPNTRARLEVLDALKNPQKKKTQKRKSRKLTNI